jgi:D-tyrosyl-tRNA(Tyr) deacylase
MSAPILGGAPDTPRGSVRRDADTAKGNRPSFTDAAPPEEAEPLCLRVAEDLRALGVTVETGVFGARMEVELVNAGPVTIVLDTENRPS